MTGAGATFPSLLYNQWFETYHKENPNTFIKYSAVGSGEGIRRFIAKGGSEGAPIDFGASDAVMQDSELAQADNTLWVHPPPS